MNQAINTFKTPPAPVIRRENTRRIQDNVSKGQVYQNEHGHWKVSFVGGGLADLVPVFADGSPRYALKGTRVESVAMLTGPFYRLCPVVEPERGSGNAVGWALIMLAVMVLGLVAYGVWKWRAGV